MLVSGFVTRCLLLRRLNGASKAGSTPARWPRAGVKGAVVRVHSDMCLSRSDRLTLGDKWPGWPDRQPYGGIHRRGINTGVKGGRDGGGGMGKWEEGCNGVLDL